MSATLERLACPACGAINQTDDMNCASCGTQLATEYDVTRYLCCAVQLDSALARKAVDEIVEEPRRAIASSPGVDLSCVLAYALDAQRRHLARDLVLAVLTVLILFTLADGLDVVMLWILLAWGVVTAELYVAHYRVIVPRLRRGSFRPEEAPRPDSTWQRDRLKAAAQQDHGNLTVFRDYAPFAGYGRHLDAWSFALRTDEAKEGADEVLPFDIHDLYTHVGEAVKRLNLPGVRVADRLFVNGTDLRLGLADRTRAVILPHTDRPPTAEASAALIRNLREDATERARPYLTVQVSGWNGDLVSTLFLRFALMPGHDVLFVEGSTTLLTPVLARYRAVDTMPDLSTADQYRALVAQGLARLPGLLVKSVPALFTAARRPLRRSGKERAQLRAIRQRSFNYGAPPSIREAAADPKYHRYFQRIDREMYTKVVERRVLDSLIEFLEAHDIDSSDLRDRQAAIYNNGIFVGDNSNVSVNDSALAIGRNAVGRVFKQTDGG